MRAPHCSPYNAPQRRFGRQPDRQQLGARARPRARSDERNDLVFLDKIRSSALAPKLRLAFTPSVPHGSELAVATPAVLDGHISLRGRRGQSDVAACSTETKHAGGLVEELTASLGIAAAHVKHGANEGSE